MGNTETIYYNNQPNAIAIGTAAGNINQGSNAIALGYKAGETNQGANSIILNATGSALNQTTPNTFTVKPVRPEIPANLPTYSSLFYNTSSGEIVSGANTPAYQTLDMSNNSVIKVNQINFADYGTYIGKEVGNSFQSVLIGGQAGLSGGQRCISIGTGAGYSQGGYCFAIGTYAGQGQLDGAMALGTRAGLVGQKAQALAFGTDAGNSNQSSGALAIGNASGQTTQGVNAIAIGNSAGRLNQQTYALAVGVAAGDNNQGANAIAIGKYAGLTNQGANSIILNATGSGLDQTTSNTFTVAPIRSNATEDLSLNALIYTASTGEITYGNKTFVIDHPLQPENYLVHACLEGPEAGVYYRGSDFIPAETTFCEITLPAYADALAKEFTVHVTPVLSAEDTFSTLAASNVEQGKFKVHRKKAKAAKQEFNYMVFGKRATLETEPLKAAVKVKGEGPYKWL